MSCTIHAHTMSWSGFRSRLVRLTAGGSASGSGITAGFAGGNGS